MSESRRKTNIFINILSVNLILGENTNDHSAIIYTYFIYIKRLVFVYIVNHNALSTADIRTHSSAYCFLKRIVAADYTNNLIFPLSFALLIR